LDAADSELFLSIYTDPITMRLVESPMSTNDAQLAFQRTLKLCSKNNPRYAYFAAIGKQSRQPIGICAASHIDIERATAEIGIMLLPDAIERHLGKAAFELLIGQLFSVLRLREIWAQHLPTHRLARRLALGAGMKVCTRQDFWHAKDGMHFVSICFGDWLAAPKPHHPDALQTERKQLIDRRGKTTKCEENATRIS
jgi:RimJ/RimL family protein N-acetyltransferase